MVEQVVVIAGLPFAKFSTDSNSGGYGSPQFRCSTAFTVEAQERPSSYHSNDTINLRYTTSSNGEDDMTVGQEESQDGLSTLLDKYYFSMNLPWMQKN